MLERPISTSSKDVAQRQVLKAVDDYLDYAWEDDVGPLFVSDAYDTLLNIHSAVKIAAAINSRHGWSVLMEAGNAVQRADWSRLSPFDIPHILELFHYWSYSLHVMEREIIKTVCLHLSEILGKLHPLGLITALTLRSELDLPTCRKILVLSEVKTAEYCLEAEQKTSMTDISKKMLAELLLRFDEIEAVEDTLKSWSPASPGREFEKLELLALSKLRLGQYDEADNLFSAALSAAPDHFWLLRNVYGCYTDSLFRQQRYEEASSAFLNGLVRMQRAMARFSQQDQIMGVEHLRLEVGEMQTDYGNFKGLDQIVEKVEAMSIAS